MPNSSGAIPPPPSEGSSQQRNSGSASTVYVALTDEQKSDLREIFELVDLDRSGSISNEELHQLMRMLGMQVTMEDVTVMVSEIDENNDGAIQFDEFLAVMSKKMRASYVASQIRDAFRTFEGSAPPGKIRFDALETLLCEYGTQRLTPAQASALVKDLHHAVDSQGLFHYDDYVSEMCTD
jgi:calmodulin